jgi:hypothetical protein
MNKNKLRSTIVTLVVAVLIGMTFGAIADSGNAPDAPKPRLTISTADASLTSMHDGGYYIAGMDMSEGRRLNRINPDMDMTHPKQFERFSGHSDISHDMPDRLIDSQMNRRTSRIGASDRSAHDRLADKDTAYQKVSYSDTLLAMSAATSSEYTFTYGTTAGDLNGDYRDDVLVFSGTYNSTTYAYTFESVSAVNGDGSELWIQSIVYETGGIEDIPAYPVGDLDGDDKDDVIVNSRSYNSSMDECTASVCARRGYDGHQFWSQNVTGDGEYGAYIWASSYCDLDGDNKDDVIVNSRSYNSYMDEYTVSVYARRGYDGHQFWSQSVTGESVSLWASSYCDLDGDNKDDVFVNLWSYDSGTGKTTASVYARRGYDGHQFWSQSVTGDGEYDADIWASSYCDLDGDNKDDVIVESWSYNSSMDEYTASVYARRGYDGHRFWSQSVTGDGERGIGAWIYLYFDLNLDGDNKDDVIVISESYDSITDEYTASVYVRRGYDGHQFWSQSVTGESVSLWAFSYCDLDGDNKDDVIVISESYDSITDEYTASVYAKRGYDGDQFWSRSVTGDGEYGAYMWAFSYCDLDGDNKDDVIVESWSYNSSMDEYTASVYARRGYDGHRFWNQSVTGDGEYADMWASSYCDLDGDDKDDVIVISESYDSITDEYTASVYAKRGYDGDQFWSRSVTSERVSLWASSYCDLDGDDKDDVIVNLWSYDSVTYEYSVYAKRGYDGDELWNQSITGEDVWIRTDYDDWHYYSTQDYSTQDFDGDNLGDILITTGIFTDFAGDIPTKVCAVKGNDGTSLWCKPSAPPVTGDLNGDGKLTPVDAVIALDIAVSGDYNEYADVNDDDAVNSLDVLMILQASVSSIKI